MRASVNEQPLNEADAKPDPIGQFQQWFSYVVENNLSQEPTAFALATADKDGAPSVRMVLLKVRLPLQDGFFLLVCTAHA